MIPDFNKLFTLHKLCRRNGVAWHLHYNEGEDTFWFDITSPAKEENLLTRDYSFDTAIKVVMEFLEELERRKNDN